MKLVVVGFYHDSYLCAVPDEVADNLWDCCLEYESTIRGRYEDMKKTKRIENLPYFWF